MSRYKFAMAQYGAQILMTLAADTSLPAALLLSRPEAKKALEDFKANPRPIDEASFKALVPPVFRMFAEELDPTHNRAGSPYKYLHFICRAYLKKPVMAEDFYKVKDALQDFETWGPRLAQDGKSADIQNYESFDALHKVLAPYQDRRDEHKAERERRRITPEVKAEIMAETTILYEGPEGKTLVPHTMRAAQYWGSRTKWCIAARDKAHNAFKDYYKKQPVIIYFPAMSETEKADFDYKSFKFATDNGFNHIFDERDKTDGPFPNSLHALRDKTIEHLYANQPHLCMLYGVTRSFFDGYVSPPRSKLLCDPAFLESIKACDIFANAYELQDRASKWSRAQYAFFIETLFSMPGALDDLRAIDFPLFEGNKAHRRALFMQGTDNFSIRELRYLAEKDVLDHSRFFSGLDESDKHYVLEHCSKDQILVLGGGGFTKKETMSLHIDRRLWEIFCKTAKTRNGPPAVNVDNFSDYTIAEDVYDSRECVLGLLEISCLYLRTNLSLHNTDDQLFEALVSHDRFGAYCNDAEIAMLVVEKDGTYLEIFADDIRDNRDIVLAAVQNSPYAYVAASERLQADPEIMAFAPKSGPSPGHP